MRSILQSRQRVRVPTRGARPRRFRSLGVGLALCLVLPLAAFAQSAPVTIVLELERNLPFGASCIPQSTLCDPARNSFLLFREVLLPDAETKQEVLQPFPKPRLIGGDFRYERVDFEHQLALDADGHVYSTHARMLWDLNLGKRWRGDQISYGFLIPYDFFDLGSYDAHRVGAIGFGRYNHAIMDVAAMHFTINGNYTYTHLDVSGFDDIHAFGTGVSLGLSADTLTALTQHEPTSFFGGLAVSYQFHTDNGSQENDQHHLFKVGASGGVRIGQNAVTQVFAVLNRDLTSYDTPIGDVDKISMDMGIELTLSVSPSWRFNMGYTKVLALADFNSDMVFLGTLFRF